MGRTVVVVLPLLLLAGLSAMAQGVQHLSVTLPGGMPGTPVMTGIQQTTNGVKTSWDGPSGYYQVWHKMNLTGSSWLMVGKATNLSRTATIPAPYSNDFFRVSGPAPRYAGAQVCAGCHGNIHASVMLTEHTGAFTNELFVQQGGQTNASCLACHTVGYGLPSGFTDAADTPQLEGVQCESCHGPAANHAANPGDPTVVPRVELAAQVCGGCHSAGFAPASVAAYHPSFFEDWSTSPHGAVVPEVLRSMASSTNSISSCGRCHSGSARLTLLQGRNPSATLTNDFSVAITCAVCHDAHAQHVWTNALNGVVYTNQLRNPLSSTNDYVLTTSAVFTNAYNPNINVCAQCHNDRGASLKVTDRAPHHSPQYNMLLGTVGELNTNVVGVVDTNAPPYYSSPHALLIADQCADCHLQAATNDASGHAFEVATYQLCLRCHTDPAGLVQFVTNDISNQIQQTKALLDMWAANKAPEALRKYGTLAWEYTTPGDLSSGGPGPDATEQGMITNVIQKARFDLYLVLYDGSYGVHNAPYDIELLQSAQGWVEGQLYQ
ncbi:MAG: hypothetical protein KGJ60_08880 [Verrucomicrobiota bacterium]|nr:hypothetical protein [Verrucomicrobiota bacterium]